MEDRIQQKIGREDSKEGKGKTYLGEKEGTGVGKQNNCREEQREEDEWDWDFFGPEPNLEDYFGGMKLHEKEKEDLYFKWKNMMDSLTQKITPLIRFQFGRE